jgi:uncharacterized protein (DUF302 family)
MATNGLTTVHSNFAAAETMDRLETEIKAAGMTIFARIDHGANASAVGLPLRTTILVIFGNAKGGTPLMQANPAAGIDLPLKALVYQDAAGQVWVAYNDPTWLADRHGLGTEVAPMVAAMTTVLDRLVARATGSD